MSNGIGHFENKRGRPYKNLRATINGIIWIVKTGAKRQAQGKERYCLMEYFF